MKKLVCILALLMIVPLLMGAQVFKGGKPAGRVITVTYAHHEIHECNHYTTVRNVASLGSGSKMQLVLNTPAAVQGDENQVHMLIAARGSGEGRYEIWEAPTLSAIGTAMREEQRNQNCLNTAGLEVTHTPTITTPGTHLAGLDRHFGAGNIGAGEVRGLNEVLLKPSTLYLVNGVSEAANNDFTLEPDWYEDSGDAP